ncbi:MAG TPA: M48 family metalloprotease [Gammaproteobacteria bacterium]|nr:M48 family metalloprotease [Gammaproteobacteria bacterium]
MRPTGGLAAGALLLALTSLPAQGAPTDARQRLSDSRVSAADLQKDLRAEMRFGRELAARILARYPLVKDDALLRYVNLVGRAVARNGGRQELTFHFGVLDTPTVNAFAAPGGYVFVTRGALERMHNEAELAGVLAHEIIHVDRKHIVRELGIHARGGSAAAGLARFLGGAGEATSMAFSQAVDRAEKILFKSGRKQADELEADRLGTSLLGMSGYRPTALRDYLARIAKEKDADTADRRRTHPPFPERLKAVNVVLRKEGLAHMKGRVKAKRFAERTSTL